MTFDWVKNHTNPVGNGNTRHKCVNWPKLQEWFKGRAIGRAIGMPKGFEWQKPEGVQEWEHEP